MTFRTACTAFAIAMAGFVASPSLALADEILPSQPQQTMLPIVDQIAQLEADIEGELYSCVELSERIDRLVDRIDEMLNGEPENKLQLIDQRRMALDLRMKLKCDKAATGADNGTTLTGTAASCNCGAHGGGSGGGGIFGGAALTGGGGGAAGGGATGGGGFGSVAGLAGIGAAIAIPIAVSGDGGSPASPSGMSNP